MTFKTEELLNLLLWTAHIVLRPTFRNLTESYEGWAYRNGLLARRLEKKQFVERDDLTCDVRFYRLTAIGRLKALGGRDPEECWSRVWDGKWRIALYDVPQKNEAIRARIRRRLRAMGYGYLQNSAWITPDPMDADRAKLEGESINVETLILLEARPCGGESDKQIVAGAWDFERINRDYERHWDILNQLPKPSSSNQEALHRLLKWGALERRAWLHAVTNDPLLPKRLLPDGYLGQRNWLDRVKTLEKAGRQLIQFNASL